MKSTNAAANAAAASEDGQEIPLQILPGRSATDAQVLRLVEEEDAGSIPLSPPRTGDPRRRHKKLRKLRASVQGNPTSLSVDWRFSMGGARQVAAANEASSSRAPRQPLDEPSVQSPSTARSPGKKRASDASFIVTSAQQHLDEEEQRKLGGNKEIRDAQLLSPTLESSSESRWNAFFQAIRPVLSSRHPSHSPSIAGPSHPFQPSAAPSTSTSAPRTRQESMREKRMHRRATIDSSVFGLRRNRTPTLLEPSPLLRPVTGDFSPRKDSTLSAQENGEASTSTEAQIVRDPADPENAAVPSPASVASPASTLSRQLRKVTSAAPRKVSFRFRRASLQLPPRTESSQHFHAYSSVRDRWKDAIDRIRSLNLPRSLFRRRTINSLDGPSDSNSTKLNPKFPLMESALAVPFCHFSQDENGHKGVPVIFEAVQIQMRDATTDELALDKDHLFYINITYGELQWTIRRSLVDFLKLHSLLSFRHLQGRLPSIPSFPSQWTYAIEKAKIYTRFSAQPQQEFMSRDFLKTRAMHQRRKAIESYFRTVIRLCNMRICNELCTFLELSAAALTKEIGHKGKEGYVKKRSAVKKITKCTFLTYHSWNWMWFVIRDNYFALFEGIEQIHPSQVFLLDSKTKVTKVVSSSRNPLKRRHYLVIQNETRELQIRTESERQLTEWLQDINRVLEATPWVKTHRHDSFAPVRPQCHIQPFVDAHDYFESVAEAILMAKDTIYIQSWWLTPEVFLKRPPALNSDYRVDRILKKKAEEGVLVYVIVYKEVSYALGINSLHTKNVLQALHPNIRVLRYPDHAPGGILYWALHDKFVVVDDSVAYLGGIDLCLGRYDTIDHAVGDSTAVLETWPGMDYSNPRVKDFQNVERYHLDLVDKSNTARMPWHDVHCMVTGLAARDVARHFVQRWNFIKQQKFKERDKTVYLLPPAQAVTQKCRPDLPCCRLQILRSVSHWSMGVDRESSVLDAYIGAINNAEHYVYIENQFFVSSMSEAAGGFSIRNPIARTLCDRIIRANLNAKKFRVYLVLPLLPAFEAEVSHVSAATTRLIMHWHQMTLWKNESWNMMDYLRAAGVEPSEYISVSSLRTHGRLGENGDGEGPTVTEQVYVHSKLMIVDDRLTIIGSANINDRSMLGSRDSEIAVVSEDEEFVTSMMDGHVYQAGRSALNLRLRLFGEHLGMSDNSILLDPLSDRFYQQVWLQTAVRNTAIYRDVFRCYPDENISDWESYQRFADVPNRTNGMTGHVAIRAPRDLVEDRLAEVQGNLVLYPLRFLSDENLSAVFPAKEFMVPMDVFV